MKYHAMNKISITHLIDQAVAIYAELGWLENGRHRSSKLVLAKLFYASPKANGATNGPIQLPGLTTRM